MRASLCIAVVLSCSVTLACAETQPVATPGPDPVPHGVNTPNVGSPGAQAPNAPQPTAATSPIARIPADANSPNGWSTWSSVTTVLFNALLVVVGFSQVYWMVRQARYMRSGLDTANANAEAARKSAEVAERALVVLNRPWLDTVKWKPIHEYRDNVGRYFGFEMLIVCEGPTPAWIEIVETRFITKENERRLDSRIGGLVSRHRPYSVITTFGPLNADEERRVTNDGAFSAEIRGKVIFRDHFQQESRVLPFARTLIFKAGTPLTVEVPEGIGLNEDATEWQQGHG